MEDDTRSIEERYEDLLAEHERVAGERDDLEQKLLRLASVVTQIEDQQYQQCAVHDCDYFPAYGVTNMPLCAKHLVVASYDQRRADEARPEYEFPEKYQQAQAERAAARKHPAVYYIAMTDHIKIGTTSNLRKRLATFCVHPDALLAIEPGGKDREHQRHVQFAHLRFGRSELFSPSESLLAHIEQARTMFGDPKQFM